MKFKLVYFTHNGFCNKRIFSDLDLVKSEYERLKPFVASIYWERILNESEVI